VRHAESVPVLMHHHVNPAPGRLGVTPANFESQLAWLARKGWTTLTLAQFGAFLGGAPMPRRSLLITFDDGYLDNWVHAYPLLARYDMHAVLFVATAWIGRGPVRPHAAQTAQPPSLPTHAACEARIAAGNADEVMIRWDEARAMQASGTFELHCHTHTHQRWWQYGSDPALRRRALAADLALSREVLLRELRQVSDHLCWPFGYFDDDYVAQARAQGFRYLHTTHAFGRNLPGGDREHIYRFPVRDRPARWLRQRLRYAQHPLLRWPFNRFKAWRRGLPPGA